MTASGGADAGAGGDPRAPRAPRALLRDDAYLRLRDLIVDGVLAPGERLRDTELTGRLGIGRTPIREALLRLERAGLVETRPGHWTTVTPIDGEATRQANQIAASLHGLAVGLAVPRMSTGDWSAMDAANRRFAAALTRDDAQGALSADDEFHLVALDRSGNPMIAAMLDQVAPLVRRAERARFSSILARESIVQHAHLVERCRAGDVPGAVAAVTTNWQSLASASADRTPVHPPVGERPGQLRNSAL